jgi:sulfopyruvate decarboxylase subunit beta
VIEAQWQFGKRLPAILGAAGIEFTTVETKDEMDRIDDAIKDSFDNARPHVVLLSPAIWEGSCCKNPFPCEITPRLSHIEFVSRIKKPEMTRYEAIKVLVSVADDDVIVSNLGIPSKELYEIKDRELNFYMTGSMGLVSSIGLGLALSQDRHVYVIDGDGSILMNPNVLASIGTYNPENLTIIAVDNAACGSTGNQGTCTGSQIDLELLARANGIMDTRKVHKCEELRNALKQRAAFIHTIVKPVNAICKEIPLSAKMIKGRFMKLNK